MSSATDPHRSPAPRASSATGFTVIEVVIALFILAAILVAVLELFDASNRIARSQIHIAEMQQSLRIGHDSIVRMTRMAARGWTLNEGGWKQSDQVQVLDNVPANTYINSSSTDATLKIAEGTDVLRIRGIVEGSIFENTSPANVFLEPSLTIDKTAPSGIPQDLEQLKRAQDAGNDFKVMLVTTLGEVGTTPAKITSLTLTGLDPKAELDISGTDGDSPSWVGSHKVSLTGIVEEYAFYIRDNNGQPRLSMARFQPGTNKPYGNDASNLRQDIADDILDLQVALAIDTGDKVIDDNEWWHGPDGTAHSTDALPVLGVAGDLTFLRISTLARTQGRDNRFVAPKIKNIENHGYGELNPQDPGYSPTTAEITARMRHRRLIETVVDLRNM